MERDEVIKGLYQIKNWKCNGDAEMYEVIASAIRLLEQPEPTTKIQEILNYLDTTLHPIVSPDNWNVYAELHDMVSKLPSAQPEEAIPISWIEAMIRKFIISGDAFSGLTVSIIRVMLSEWEKEQEGEPNE